MPDDLAALVADLADLHRALAATTDYGRAATPSTVVGATLAPTAAPGDGRRGVPGSRPPLDLSALQVAEAIETRVVDLLADVRVALNLPVRPVGPVRALSLLARATEALPEGHPLRRRVPAVLDALRGRARFVLDLDARWLILGPCPEIHQDAVPVAWDSDGVAVAYVEVRDCVTYDVLASLDATRRRRAGRPDAGPVDVWRRSHLRIDRDADLTTADVTCPGCHRRWPPGERARLAGIIERETAALMGAM